MKKILVIAGLILFLVSCQKTHQVTIYYDQNNFPLIVNVIDGEFLDIQAIQKEGHTLEGLYTSLDGISLDEKWSFVSDTVNGDITLYAKWNVNQYKIEFETNGGTIIPVKYFNYDSQIILPETEKEGHSFVNWYLDIEFNDEFKLTEMPAENITLYAKWAIDKYKITFDTDGGSSIDTIIQDYATAIIAPEDPTREGYTFIGWDVTIPTSMPSNDLTIKAKYLNYVDSVSLVDDAHLCDASNDYIACSFISNYSFVVIYDLELNIIRTIYPTNLEERFGINIKIDDDYLYITSRFQDINKINIYSLSNENYFKTITQHYPAISSRFGIDFEINDEYLIIPDYKYEKSMGAVFIYDKNTFEFLRTFTESNNSNISYGNKVYVEGNNLIVESGTINKSYYIYNISNINEEMIFVIDSDSFTNVYVYNNYLFLSKNTYNSYQGIVFAYKFDDPNFSKTIESPVNDKNRFGSNIFVFENILYISDQNNTTLYQFNMNDLTYFRSSSNFLKSNLNTLFFDDFVISYNCGAVCTFNLFNRQTEKVFSFDPTDIVLIGAEILTVDDKYIYLYIDGYINAQATIIKISKLIF